MSAAVVGAGSRLLFVSCATYELAKRLGAEEACREFLRQCAEPSRESLPAARMIARLRTLGNVGLLHTFGSQLTKMRSRAAHAALKSGADFWLQLDDDVECDSGTLLRVILTAGEPSQPRAAVLPCLLRGTAAERSTVNVKWANNLLSVGNGGPCRKAELAGTGLMVLTRAALEQVVEHCRSELPRWLDDDGEVKAPLFHQLFESSEDGTSAWYGEDLSFCRRLLRAGVEIYAPTSGWSIHDGHRLDLGTLE